MIVKFFKKSGSASAAIKYLKREGNKFTDEDRENKRILSGDPDLSASLAESLKFENSYTCGCLSFEEKNISEQSKIEIMERFEKSVFAGLDQNQFNITWIEHTDKGRLELNFFIPNVEMQTGKRLQPYYDKADRPLIENFKQVINHEYGLTNPNDLAKKQATQLTAKNLPKKPTDAKKAIDKAMTDLIANKAITSRKELINVLEESGFKIARITDKSISIKNPEPNSRNIRLKGAIYEDGRTYQELRNEHKTAVTSNHKSRESDYRKALERHSRAVTARSDKHQAKFATQEKGLFLNDAKRINIDTITNSIYSGASLGLASEQSKPRDRANESTASKILQAERNEPESIQQNEIRQRGQQTVFSNSNELGSKQRREVLRQAEPGNNNGIRKRKDNNNDFLETIKRLTKHLQERAKRITERLRNTYKQARSILSDRETTQQRINDTQQRINNSQQQIERSKSDIERANTRIISATERANEVELRAKRTQREIKPKIKAKRSRGMGMGM